MFWLILALLLTAGGGLQAKAGGDPSIGAGLHFRGINGSFGSNWIGIPRVQAHWAVDEGQKIEIGGEIGYNFGLSFTPSFFAVTVDTKYNFNQVNDGPFVGGYFDFGVTQFLNYFSLGGQGGYTFSITEVLSVGALGRLGFGSRGGGTFRTGRFHGFDWGLNLTSYFTFRD